MILDSLVKRFKIRRSIAFAIDVVTNLNKDAIIQIGIAQFGVYKYLLFGLYFTFIV